MITLADRYHSYLHGTKKMRIDGCQERVKDYGWSDNGKEIVGHYVITENYKLHYNMDAQFVRMEALKELETVA